MSRRRGTFLDRILERNIRACNGEIRKVSGLWQFVGANLGKPLDNIRPTGTCASTGKPMELVKGPAVFCLNPEMDGKYPMTENPPRPKTWHVPIKHCQTCPHHTKAGQGLPYPHCRWERAQRGGTAGAVKEVAETVSRAVEETNRMMGIKREE